MTESVPKCDPMGLYSVKRTCAVLEVCKKTLQKYRRQGIIAPINNNPKRYKYTGQSIIDCWEKVKHL